MNTTCIRIEGGLLSPDFLECIHTQDGQKPKDFGVTRSLVDEIASVWADAQTYWKAFERRRAHASTDSITTITREQWVSPLLEALGYRLVFQRRAVEVDGRTYAISHRALPSENQQSKIEDEADAPPVHIVGYDLELGNRPPAGRGTLSPHGLLQDYLNRSEHLWGIVTNGYTLRLLRESVYFTRPAYIEFDLKQMFEGGRLDEFILFYRLAHRTRLPQGIDDADQCWLERYHQVAIEQGGRIREGLRDAVEQALVILANGFLAHPKNETLREKIRQGKLTAREFYRQLLYLIYRLLFLLVAEERNILLAHHPLTQSPNHFDAGRFYHDNLSIARLRALAGEPLTAPERFDDLYLGLRMLFYILSDEPSSAQLGLPTLNGELFNPLEDLDHARLSNRALLEAIAKISYFEPEGDDASSRIGWHSARSSRRRDDASKVRRRVNYAALDVEELGSVYESLLEFQPVIANVNGRLEFAFAAGTERKSTGSYYTAPQLVSELIQGALVPVLQERLKSAKTAEEKKQAILSIKVCDPACGSGHFLLAAARTLGKELAKIEMHTDEPSPEAIRRATREVITHCIYGVDKNPLAVDLCKVALWLEGHAEGKPLTFLDHRIRCGDSLVGVRDLAVLEEGIPDEAFEPVAGDDKKIASALKKQNRQEREGQMGLPFDASQINALVATRHSLLAIADETPAQIRRKKAMYEQWREQSARDRITCDLWTAAFFADLTRANRDDHRIPTTDALWRYRQRGGVDERLTGAAIALAEKNRFFHWALEFPEVFSGQYSVDSGQLERTEQRIPNTGFDVILSNPPFIGGLKISGTFGEKYRHYLTQNFAPFKGTADLCAAFYRRAFALLKRDGMLGMVATNTIGQGDTREAGLAVITRNGGTITAARRFIKWQGAANVEVNLVNIRKGAWHGEYLLDGQPVETISSRLDAEPEAEPQRLKQNEGKAFQGDIVRGIGFVLEPAEAEVLLARDPRNAECLLPYLNGEDLNSHPQQQPSRYVICFHDWELERAREYPDLLRIVEERVKPERERLHGPGDKRNREYWWQFGAYRAGMRRAIAALSRVLVRSRIAEMHALMFVPKGWVYNEKTIVFTFDDDYHFVLLQSNVHEVWMRRFTSTLRTDINYSPTDCFDNFTFPQTPSADAVARAAETGAAYHEHRRQMMLARQIGLTATYNLFHNPQCVDADVARLRELHAEMDRAILACYGWQDLNPQHDFYQNERGQTRYTVSPSARREILRRLLVLNQEIAEKERA